MTNIFDENFKSWKVFSIEELFTVEKVKGKPIDNYKIGNIPYVATSSSNNGVTGFVSYNDISEVSKGNAITINPIGGEAYYQKSNFIGRGYSGASVIALYNDYLNHYNSLFICPIIETSSKDRASYGTLLNGDRLLKTKFKLPINLQGTPDWEYMTELGKNIYFQSKEFIYKYISNKHTQLSKELYGKEELTLSNREWLPFRIGKIFTTIQRGKRLTKANQISGNKPYISSTALNNGVDSFIGNETNVRVSGQDITIANSGSVGNAFYHPYEYVASDHVHSLGNVKYNEYQYLFIVTMLNRLQTKYHFNYEINDKRLKSDKLMLPVTNEGELDLAFMEDYMKRIEYEQLTKLIDYLN